MAKYVFDVMVHGRVSIVVEADSEAEAVNSLYDSPDYPSLDKVFDSDRHLVDVIE